MYLTFSLLFIVRIFYQSLQFAGLILEWLSQTFWWKYMRVVSRSKQKECRLLFQVSLLLNCLSISTCFALSRNTGLWAMLIGNLLSQYKLMRRLTICLSSTRTLFNHNPSHTPRVIDLNSATILLLETTLFFASPSN